MVGSRVLVASRAGRVGLGCLLTLVLAGAATYYGAGVARVFWRYYEFRDAMRQRVAFAEQLSNQDIVRELRTMADSLGLPAEARRITVRRTGRGITVRARYTDTLALPLAPRTHVFSPQAERVF